MAMLVAHYNRVMPKASLSIGTLQALVGQRDNKLFEAMQAVCCTSSAEPIFPPGPLLVPTAVHSHVTLHQSHFWKICWVDSLQSQPETTVALCHRARRRNTALHPAAHALLS